MLLSEGGSLGEGVGLFLREVAWLVIVMSLANFLLRRMFLAVGLGQLWVLALYFLKSLGGSTGYLLLLLQSPFLNSSLAFPTHTCTDTLSDITSSQPNLVCPCFIYFICWLNLYPSHQNATTMEGKEHWANLRGRNLFIYSDLTSLSVQWPP